MRRLAMSLYGDKRRIWNIALTRYLIAAVCPGNTPQFLALNEHSILDYDTGGNHRRVAVRDHVDNFSCDEFQALIAVFRSLREPVEFLRRHRKAILYSHCSRLHLT